MAGTAGERLHGLVNEQTVDAVLDAIDQALEQALIAATGCERRGQLNQVNSAVDTSSGDAPLDPWIARSGC